MIDKVQIYTSAAAGAIVGVPLALALVQDPSILNQISNIVLIAIIAVGTWILIVSNTINSKEVLEARPRVPRVRKPREQRLAFIVEEALAPGLGPAESEQFEKQWERVLVHIRDANNQHREEVPAPPPPRPVVADAEALEDDAACVICMENKKTTCAVPCGHKILCNSCSREADFETCPICRTPCDKIIRVYD
jgi:hypothetical protein